MSNFTTRVISSIIGGAIMIAILILGGEVLLTGLCIVSIIGLFELTKATGIHDDNKKANSLEIVDVVMTIALYVLTEFAHKTTTYELSGVFCIMIICIMALMVVYVFSFPKYNAAQVMSALFSFIYCPVMLLFIYLVRELNYGVYLVWMVFVCSWFCDIFAYLVGIKIGKHKFVPKLSPKKSTEGAIGGVAGSALIGALYAAFILAPEIESRSKLQVVISIVILSMLGAMISMIGDLAASAIKRNNDIKDYGKIIPGHGGIMDRFDSVIFVAPIVFILSLVFLAFIG